MFTSGTDTLLGVGGAVQPGHRVGRVDGVEEDGLELRRKRHRKQKESNQPEGERHRYLGETWRRMDGAYLVHAGVGKKQRGVVQRDGGRRVDVLVLIAAEEVDELLADLRCTQRGVHSESAD